MYTLTIIAESEATEKKYDWGGCESVPMSRIGGGGGGGGGARTPPSPPVVSQARPTSTRDPLPSLAEVGL